MTEETGDTDANRTAKSWNQTYLVPALLVTNTVMGFLQSAFTAQGNTTNDVLVYSWLALISATIPQLFSPFFEKLERAAYFGVYLVIFLGTTIVLFCVLHLSKPTIRFTYKDHIPPWFEFVEGYDAYRAIVKIEPSIALKKASAYLVSIARVGSPNKLLNYSSRMMLCWPHNTKAFEQRNVSPIGDGVVVFLGNKNGKTLQLCSAETFEFTKDFTKDTLPIGDFDVIIEIDADNIENMKKRTQKLRVHWTGDITQFRMNLVDD